MRVLAIDPGYERCGVAVLEQERGGKEDLLYSECLQTSTSLPFPERLRSIVDSCVTIMERYNPSALAIERLYFNTNQKTAMAVAEVRGALLYAATVRDIAVSEYTPSSIKTAVAGWGRADKQQVITMVGKIVAIKEPIEFDDEYDAIAIGITHLAHSRSHH